MDLRKINALISSSNSWQDLSDLLSTDKSLTDKVKGLKIGEGISSWRGEHYNKEVKKCARVWPHHNDTDAFFLARMEKC